MIPETVQYKNKSVTRLLTLKGLNPGSTRGVPILLRARIDEGADVLLGKSTVTAKMDVTP